MSLWYLTSSENAHREAQRVCERAGLRPSGEISETNCYGRAYFKRFVTTDNLAKCGDDAWICSAGTIIYESQMGYEALRKCYSDFNSAGISAIQSKALGHYALAIRRANEVTVFTAPDGALSLYYVDTGSFWFITNSMHVCASVLPIRKLDSTKLLITAIQGALPGEDTFYSGIKRLFGNQLIHIDLVGGTFRTECIPQPPLHSSCDLPSIEDALDRYKEEVRTVFRELIAAGSIGLFGTGGKDSRTILAALVDQQAPLQMMYGTGNSRITDSSHGDLAAAQSVAKLYDIPFQQLDWSGNQPHTKETLQRSFRTYGFQAEIYGASESFLRTLNGGIFPYPKIFLGGHTPATMGDRPWELDKSSFTMDDLISDGMHSQSGFVEDNRCIVDKATYRSAYAAEVETALRHAGIEFPTEGASLKLYVEAKLFLINRSGARFINFVNEFGHFIAPFNLTRLWHLLMSVPFKYRKKDEFQNRLIHSLAPALASLPLFSGGGAKDGPARIDQKTFQMVRVQREQKKPLSRRIAKRAISSRLREPVKELYFGLAPWEKFSPQHANYRDFEIRKAYSAQVMSDPLGSRWFNGTSDFSPKELSRILQYIVGVNTLGYSE
jgi:hypothetical protein